MLLKDDQTHFLANEDCILHMPTMPDACMDFSIFSPPFPSVFAYSEADADIGNSEDLGGDGKIHLAFFANQLVRIMKPGRVVMIHVMQIPRMKRVDKRGGMIDFRGLVIRLAERAGFIYEYDWMVRRNPQAQAIRTRSRELQFVGLEKDRARSRGCMNDYLIKFLTPGENAVPVTDKVNAHGDFIIDSQISRNDWIGIAEGCWSDIKETDTLNVRGTKDEEDTKHICPLQLGVIRRCVKMFTNPGEIVFSPFAGIGSEGYESIKIGRRFYGCELKKGYYDTAIKNLDAATKLHKTEEPLFLFADATKAEEELTEEVLAEVSE